MAELFGDQFQQYKQAVPLFIPRLTPFRQADTKSIGFDGSLYMRYREYRAALGLAVAWGLLLAKSYYLR